MSAPSVVQASPDELRRAARLLRTLGEEVEELGERTVDLARLGDGWQGVAALEQQARAAALRQLVRLSAGPGREVAGVLDAAAEAAESGGARVRAWTRRAEDCAAELLALRTMGPPPDPLLEAAWRRRVQQVEQEVTGCRALIEQAEQDWRDAQAQVARTVSGAWSAVQELDGLRRAFEPVVKVGMKVKVTVLQAVHTTRGVIALAQATWSRSASARAAALQRAQAALAGFFRALTGSKPLTLLRRVKLIPGPVGWALTWGGAWEEVRTGAGYPGLRGAVTRVGAGATLVAGPLAVAGLVFPPAGAIGIGIIQIYQLWMLGNAIYDQWPAIVRYARLGWRYLGVGARSAYGVLRRAGERAGAGLRELRTRALATVAGAAVRAGRAVDRLREGVGEAVGGAVQDVRSRVVGLPSQVSGLDLPDARDVARVLDGLVTRSPDSAWLRDRLREMGEPLRLPSTPLGPTLRAPIDLGWGWGGGRRGAGAIP